MKRNSARINVLHLVDSLELGGLERIVSQIVQSLDRSKFNVEVCCIVSGGAVADQLLKKGIKVHVLGIRQYSKWKNIKKLILLLRELDSDIIHMHGIFSHKIGVIASLFSGVSVKIMHIHTLLFNISRKNILIDKFLRLFVDQIIYVSQACLDSFKEKGYGNAGKSRIIYNGANMRQLDSGARDQKEIVCTVVANLNPQKGHKVLLQSIRAIIKEHAGFRLLIVGQGVLHQELKSIADSFDHSSQIEFLGMRSDIEQILSKTDIFVLPSLREGMPLALIEAMACGKAIVASKVGGIPEIISDGKNGLLVEPANAEDLEEKIRILINDYGKREALGRQARLDYERRFTLEKMTEEIDRLYAQCSKKG